MRGTGGEKGRPSKLWVLCLAIAALAVLVAGCGSSDDGGSDTGPSGIQAGTGSAAATAKAAALKSAGPRVNLPKKKVGILQILGSIESAQRAQNTINEAIHQLGWTSTVCDAQGDPTKMASCGDSLLNQNVDAIFVLGIEPSLIKAQLQKAKDMGVPMIEFSGEVTPDPLWTARYYPNEEKAGKILADSLIQKLKPLDGTSDIAVADYPAIWGAARTDQLKNAVATTNGKVKITANSVTDATNLVQGTQKTVTDQITQNPDLKAFWFAFDSAGQAAAPAIAAKYPGKTFPDRPWVVTFHADLGTQDLIRQGAIDEVVDVPYDAAGWVAVDQAAQYFARKTPFSTNPQVTYNGFSPYDYEIVTKDNLPPKGEYRTPANDFVTFFETKWQKEFGK